MAGTDFHVDHVGIIYAGLFTKYLLDNRIDMVTRQIEPLAGTGRGLPMGMNLSPKSGMAFEAGPITLTS